MIVDLTYKKIMNLKADFIFTSLILLSQKTARPLNCKSYRIAGEASEFFKEIVQHYKNSVKNFFYFFLTV